MTIDSSPTCLSDGADAWVENAEGWIEEKGWGLYGPEIPEEDT